MKRKHGCKVCLFLVIIFFSFFSHGHKSNAEEDFSSYRIYGDTRYTTAVEISKEGWPTGSETVVLAKGNDFPDALAGSPLARKLNAPILLTSSSTLHKATKREIERLGATNVILLGGSGAISDNVLAELNAMGLSSKRIKGSTRYETSIEIAKELGSTNGQAIIASGQNFADALAAAPYAAEHQIPIILTKSDAMPASTEAYISDFSNTIIVGGSGAVSQTIADQLPSPVRISGKDRYETASEFIRFGYEQNPHIYVSTGSEFADALTGSVLAAKNNTAVLLVSNRAISQRTDLLLAEQTISSFKVFGGTLPVSDETISRLLSKLQQNTDVVGGAELTDQVNTLTVQEENALETALQQATYQADGSILIEVAADSNLSEYTDGDLLLIPPAPDNPQGLIAQVGAVTTSNGRSKIQLSQPPLEAIFDNLKINVEKELAITDIVDMNLAEGVELVTDSGDALSSMEELKTASISSQSETAISPDFTVNPEPLVLSINNILMKTEETEIKITGNYELDASKIKLNVDLSDFFEPGLLEAFNFEFKGKEKIDAGLLVKWEGDLIANKTKTDQWFEGVERDGRTTLASITFTVGAITYGDAAMSKVPVGLTVILVSSLDGTLSLEGKLSFVNERSHSVKAEWKKGSENFAYTSNSGTPKSSIELNAVGELNASKGIGLDVGINIFNVLPAVIENDLKYSLSTKGNGTASWDLSDSSLLPELEGCLESKVGAGVSSTFKFRSKAAVAKWEAGAEYEDTFLNKDFFKTELNKCVPSGKVTGTASDAKTGEKMNNVKVTAYKEGEFYRSATTDENGKYEIELTPGLYKLEFSKLLYQKEVINNAEVTTDGLTYNPELKLIFNEYLGEGTAEGTIKDALNGNPVSNAEITFRKGMNTTSGEEIITVTTDADGKYTVALNAGTYTANVKKAGYIDSSFHILSIGSINTPNQDGMITPILSNDELRIILSWGDYPDDLDSHLYGHYTDGTPYHLYFGAKEAYENEAKIAVLDIDAMYGKGPETVTILKQTPGTYEYYVHDFSNSMYPTSLDLSASDAKVQVYRGSHLVKTFYVPTNKPGTLWKVFKLEGNTIIPINELTGESIDSQSPFHITENLKEKAAS